MVLEFFSTAHLCEVMCSILPPAGSTGVYAPKAVCQPVLNYQREAARMLSYEHAGPASDCLSTLKT